MKVKPAVNFPPPMMNKQQPMRPKTEGKYKVKAPYYSDSHLPQPAMMQSVDPLDMLLEEMDKEDEEGRVGGSSRLLGHKANLRHGEPLYERRDMKTPKRRQEYGEWVKS